MANLSGWREQKQFGWQLARLRKQLRQRLLSSRRKDVLPFLDRRRRRWLDY
jgi:hypothetical protein